MRREYSTVNVVALVLVCLVLVTTTAITGAQDSDSVRTLSEDATAAAENLESAKTLAEGSLLLQGAGLSLGLGLGLIVGAVGGLRYYRGRL